MYNGFCSIVIDLQQKTRRGQISIESTMDKGTMVVRFTNVGDKKISIMAPRENGRPDHDCPPGASVEISLPPANHIDFFWGWRDEV